MVPQNEKRWHLLIVPMCTLRRDINSKSATQQDINGKFIPDIVMVVVEGFSIGNCNPFVWAYLKWNT